MKIKEIRFAALGILYEAYEEKGARGAISENEIERRLSAAKPGVVDEVLRHLRDGEGLAVNGETSGTVHLWQLTTQGVELVEEDPEEAEGIALVKQTIFHGGTFTNVQTGDHAVQNITYTSVLQSLVEQIEKAPDVPPEQKSTWIGALRGLIAHPLTQTAIQTGATLAAAMPK